MSEQITHLPIDLLRESPTNPRTHFPEAELVELSDSILSQGVLQPIIVRPITYPDGAGTGPNDPTHEIVFGHRRFRASERAGLVTIPCIVRAMTDEAVAMAQLTENMARQDVTALEEADAMRRLVDDVGVTSEYLMAQTGKSRSYVYARLQLARASQPVRQAVMSGMSAEIGLLVSRLPASIQPNALERVTVISGDQTSWLSYRSARDALKRLTEPLSDAQWPIVWKTPTPGPAPVLLSCRECKQNSANNHELESDYGPDVCTHPECFAARGQAWNQHQIEMARSAGTLLEIPDQPLYWYPGANFFDGYTSTRLGIKNLFHFPEQNSIKDLSSIQEAIDALSAGDVPGYVAPTVHLLVLERHHNQLVEVVRDIDAEKVADDYAALRGWTVRTTRPAPISTPSSSETTTQQGAGESEASDEAGSGDGQEEIDLVDTRSEAERAVCSPLDWGAIRRALARSAVKGSSERTRFDLEVLAYVQLVVLGCPEYIEEALGWAIDTDASAETIMEQIRLVGSDQISSMLLACALDSLPCAGRTSRGPNGSAGLLLDIVQHYGVDPLNPEPQMQPAAASIVSDEAGCAGGEAQPERPAPPVVQRPGRPVAYRNPETGESWSGRGLKPKWLAVALESGRALAEFEVHKEGATA